ncbi:MAG TPA: peroxiredoxin [Polyangiaceae bacterium]|nr:peroxiredoxin [Polyangiaceae bacterium]
MLAIGSKAPDFNGLDQDGNLLSLDQLLQQGRLVLYFYPRDFTRVCTTQVCLFRDFATELHELSASVAGVSTDPSETHKKFAAQYKVAFPLLADPDGEISRSYQADRWLLNLSKRITYVIDLNRTILGAFHHEFSAEKHLEDVKRTLGAPS